jgi:hypothetical protein
VVAPRHNVAIVLRNRSANVLAVSERPDGTDPTQHLRLSGSLEAIAPIVVFVVLNRLFGLRWAVVGATIWSLKVVIDRYRRGQPLGRFLPLVTVAVIGRGVIGVITDSETVYFGLGIATNTPSAPRVLLRYSFVHRSPRSPRRVCFPCLTRPPGTMFSGQRWPS